MLSLRLDSMHFSYDKSENLDDEAEFINKSLRKIKPVVVSVEIDNHGAIFKSNIEAALGALEIAEIRNKAHVQEYVIIPLLSEAWSALLPTLKEFRNRVIVTTDWSSLRHKSFDRRVALGEDAKTLQVKNDGNKVIMWGETTHITQSKDRGYANDVSVTIKTEIVFDKEKGIVVSTSNERFEKWDGSVLPHLKSSFKATLKSTK